MEIRQNVRRIPTRPIAFIIAVLSAVALALTGWYVLGSSTPSRSMGVQTPYTAAGPGPDAQERNQQLAAQQLAKEGTHGH